MVKFYLGRIDWMKITLILAGLYNIIWGTWVVLLPYQSFDLTSTPRPHYIELWQCVGMIVAVYGLGYLISAQNVYRHWPIILVGYLGKIFGPIGFIGAIYNDVFPITFGVNIIFNDLIWWIPFTLILLKVLKNKPSSLSKHFTIQELSTQEDRYRAKLINSLSGVKSANLIGTKSNYGQENVSIVSSVFHLGASPALIGFIIRPDKARRDTLNNIRENGFFTINHVNENIVLKSHQTSARYEKNESEFDQCGLCSEYINDHHAPYVKESHIKMALELVREENIPENGTHLIIAKIIHIVVPENIIEKDGHLNIQKAGSVAVTGLDEYQGLFSFGRLSYAKTKTIPKWIK